MEVVFLLNHVFLLLLRREHKPFWVRNGWVSFLSALLKGISSVAANREEYVHYWATQIFSACHTCCHIALQWIRCSEVLFTSCDSVLFSACVCVCVYMCVFVCHRDKIWHLWHLLLREQVRFKEVWQMSLWFDVVCKHDTSPSGRQFYNMAKFESVSQFFDTDGG